MPTDVSTKVLIKLPNTPKQMTTSKKTACSLMKGEPAIELRRIGVIDEQWTKYITIDRLSIRYSIFSYLNVGLESQSFYRLLKIKRNIFLL